MQAYRTKCQANKEMMNTKAKAIIMQNVGGQPKVYADHVGLGCSA